MGQGCTKPRAKGTGLATVDLLWVSLGIRPWAWVLRIRMGRDSRINAGPPTDDQNENIPFSTILLLRL